LQAFGLFLLIKNSIINLLNLTAMTATAQSLVDFFAEELDEIYYPGYTQEIIDSEPSKFDWELAEFLGQFSEVE
jgi:hypothetical protein